MDMTKQTSINVDQMALEMLGRLLPENQIEAGQLMIKNLDLKISAHVPKQAPGVVQIQWTMSHPLFDEDLVEVNAGTGKDIEHALMQGAENFLDSLLNTVIHALKKENGKRTEWKVNDKSYHFSCYEGNVIWQGYDKLKGTLSFGDLLCEAVKARLGNKRMYLVKVFGSKLPDGKVRCECFVNGRMYPALNRIVMQAVSKWENEGTFCMQKQSFIWVQDEASYTPYRFTKKEVQSYTMEALMFYRSCDNEEAFNALEVAFNKICGDASFSKMLHVFIPEIFTEVMYPQHQYADEIVMRKGDRQIYLCRNQLTAFDWIYDTVERTICAGYYTQHQIQNILKWSGSLHMINEAKKLHPELGSVKLAGLGFYIDDTFSVE